MYLLHHACDFHSTTLRSRGTVLHTSGTSTSKSAIGHVVCVIHFCSPHLQQQQLTPLGNMIHVLNRLHGCWRGTQRVQELSVVAAIRDCLLMLPVHPWSCSSTVLHACTVMPQPRTAELVSSISLSLMIAVHALFQ